MKNLLGEGEILLVSQYGRRLIRGLRTAGDAEQAKALGAPLIQACPQRGAPLVRQRLRGAICDATWLTAVAAAS
jgi:hypothetical protein